MTNGDRAEGGVAPSGDTVLNQTQADPVYAERIVAYAWAKSYMAASILGVILFWFAGWWKAGGIRAFVPGEST